MFLFLATFRRNAKTSELDPGALRAELTRELDRVRMACEGDAELRTIWDRLRYALVTTADQVILASPWAHRAQWAMQLLEADVYGTREGGKRFFQLVEQSLNDGSGEGVLLAHALFHCMGLGFQGELRNDPNALQVLRQRLYDKAQLPSQIGDRITPDAYGRNTRAQTLKLPTVGIVQLLVIAVAAIVFAVIAGDQIVQIANADTHDAIEQAIEKIDTDGSSD